MWYVGRDEVLDDETAEERLGPTCDKRERVCCELSGYYAESSSNRRTYLLMNRRWRYILNDENGATLKINANVLRLDD